MGTRQGTSLLPSRQRQKSGLSSDQCMRTCLPSVATWFIALTFMFSLKRLSHAVAFRPSRPAALARLGKVGPVRLLSTNSEPYNHLEVETKWQQYWEENKTFVAKRRPNHPKKYVLDMFPYPSGAGLHVGHPEGYTATDIMARYWRMKDFDVLHPMGWDSFGLPAEQHAINTGTHPAQTTYENIATFKRQLKSLGFSYDWTRELATTDKDYVRWTQWIFLQLFKAGLAGQSEVSVNWCPKLGTVLANEEIIDGLSERGGHPVYRQPLRQWVLKITQYADKLEAGLGMEATGTCAVEGGKATPLQWPEGTLSAQKQWIGRSVGAEIEFALPMDDAGTPVSSLKVFTTRPDTLMGVSYLVLAPEHPLVAKLTTPEQRGAVDAYLAQIAGKSDMERTSTGKDRGKTGVALGSFATHPITGEAVPIWTADYVLAGYGTGAVMAVPAHDERDFEFAQTFSLPIKQVIQPVGAPSTDAATLPYTGDGVLINSSAELDGRTSAEAQEVLIGQLEASGRGRRQVTYKLRDWVFSRQRYWGEPIPIYFPVEMAAGAGPSASPLRGDPHTVRYDQPIPVPDDELPLLLPEMVDFHPGDDPRGCLARAKDWVYFQRDGQWFARETNTMPQWAGSCWYYLRFADPHNEKALLSPEAASWLPVDLYVGGQEHAVLHLLYARFWHKVLYDLGVVDHPEPFLKLVHQGMILGSDNEKMSKSRGNVVNPDDIVKDHGADALRMYEMFMGPLEATKPWQSAQVMGVVRFREKVFNLVRSQCAAAGPVGLSNDPPEGELLRETHRTIKKVTQDVESMAFNTAISNLMIYTNKLTGAAKDTVKSEGRGTLPRQALETLVLLLSPFAPHVAEECWQLLGHRGSLAYVHWPTYREELCTVDKVTLSVSVNGKARGILEVDAPPAESQQNPASSPEEQAGLVERAMQLERVAAAVAGKGVKKVIYVPGKVLNIIV